MAVSLTTVALKKQGGPKWSTQLSIFFAPPLRKGLEKKTRWWRP